MLLRGLPFPYQSFRNHAFNYLFQDFHRDLFFLVPVNTSFLPLDPTFILLLLSPVLFLLFLSFSLRFYQGFQFLTGDSFWVS